MLDRKPPQKSHDSSGSKVTFRDVITDPLLPALIAGLLACGFYLAIFLEVPTDLIVLILIVGCVTAVIEVIMRHRMGLKR